MLMDASVDGQGLPDAALDASPDAPRMDAMAVDAMVMDAMVDAMVEPERGLLSATHRALFIGNSYSGGVVGRYRSLAERDPMMRDPLQVDGITPGGQRLAGHLASAEMMGSRHHTALMGPLDVVILQEQSQIAGFPTGNADLEASTSAAVGLTELVEMAGATAVFYMTWGRRDGDSRNPTLYPDFLSMQERLEQGYRRYVREAREAGFRPVIAPVGPAFRLIYRDIEAEGMDPLNASSEFYGLYAGDGSHPSASGTYLAASVILGAVLGGPVAELDWMPGALDEETARRLRLVADRANSSEWERD